MQSTSLNFDSAAEAFEQTPISSVKLGWGNNEDLDGTYDELQVKKLTIDRSLSSNLPEEVQVVSGFAAASLDVEIGPPSVEQAPDDDFKEKSASWWFNRNNEDSPLFGEERLNSPVKAKLGYATDAYSTGVEYLDKFNGFVRSVATQGSSESASIAALDYREKLRSKVDLPLIMGAAGSGVIDIVSPDANVKWVLDHILSANGIQYVPSELPGCMWKASLLGSMWPDVGKATYSSNDYSTVYPFLPRWVSTGPFGLGVDQTVAEWDLDTTNTSSPAPGNSVCFEGWVYGNSTSTEADIFRVYTVATGIGTTNPHVNFGILSGVPWIKYTRINGGSQKTRTAPTLQFASTAAWHYVSIKVTFNASTTSSTFCVDGVTASFSDTDTTGSWGGNFDIVDLDLDGTTGVAVVACQLTNNASFSFRSAFVSEADIDNSTNFIMGVLPVSNGDSWDMIREISEAEFASFFFDELGMFHWWNNQRLDATIADPPVATVTSTRSLLDVTQIDSIDLVRNQVRVPAKPLIGTGATQFWKLQDSIFLAHSTTTTLWASFQNPIWSLVPPVVTVSSPTNSYVNGNTASDGSGSLVTGPSLAINYTIFGDAIKIDLINNHVSLDFWILGENITGTAGVALYGSPIIQGDAVYSEAVDGASPFLPQILEIEENKWMQHSWVAETHANWLVDHLKDPTMVIQSMSIIGDPRLQLADKVLVQDKDGMNLEGEYWITGIRDEYDNSPSYTCSITARRVPG